jgi:hypothetical protein
MKDVAIATVRSQHQPAIESSRMRKVEISFYMAIKDDCSREPRRPFHDKH